MKKITLFKQLVFTLCCLISSMAISQNPLWTLPKSSMHFQGITSPAGTNLLPAPGGAPSNYWSNGNYNGTYVNNSVHNIYGDTAGNPMLFVVDGVVYNRAGYLIDGVHSPLTSTGVNEGDGWAEICIVPDPASCTQYYIFTSGYNGEYCIAEIGTSNVTYNHTPIVMKIDLAQQNPYYSNQLGKNISAATSPYTANDLFTLTNTKWPAGDSGTCSPFQGDIHYAVTKLISNSYRLLFLNSGNEMVVYKIDGTGAGIHFLYNYSLTDLSLPALGSDYTNLNTSELEVYENVAHNRVKVAFTGPGAGGGDIGLAMCDFNLTTGALISGSYHYVCYGDGGGCCSFSGASIISIVSGLEFSPDGSHLWFTHTSNHCHAHNIDCVDTLGTTFNHFTPTNGIDFSTSQIEIGKDGKLYLAGYSSTNGRRLATISNPNTPGSSTFTDNAISLTTSGYPTSTQTTNFLPDQIDRETYGYQLYGSPTCCLVNTIYDKFTYQTGDGGWSATKQTWKGGTGNNPLAAPGNSTSTVTIGKELRILPGYTITIQNMTIKFSPQATFVIEGYSGATNSGQLILKKCTLDVDNRCLTQMWPGVRVWGNNTVSRSNTTQGYILLDSSCVITNAWVGIELGYQQNNEWRYNAGIAPKPPILLDSTRAGGGQINCQNSSFINNQRDIYFGDYTSGTSGLESVFKNTFVTNAYLIGGSSIPPLYHIQLNNYKPNANLQGNVFSCSTSLTAAGYVYACEGIHSVNSTASLDWSGGSIKNRFYNFNYGIYASNTGGNTNTISVKNSTLTNNVIGAYFGNLINPTFQSDSVRVRQLSGFCFGNGCGSYYSGLFLDNTTGYKVQFNNFLQNTTGTRYPFGVVASNSGAHVNCIFKNTFKDLFKGSQAQYRNFASAGSPLPHNYLGLIYLCNTFTGAISNADIYIPATASSANLGTAYTDTSAIMFNQGTQSASYPQVGGNTFSKTTGGSDFWIETTGKVIGSNYIYYCTTSCPGASVNPDNNPSTFVTRAAYNTDVNCATDPYSNGLRISNMVQYMINRAADYKITADSISEAIGSLSAGDSTEKYSLGIAFGNARSTRHRLMDEAIHLLMEDTLDRDSAEIVIHSLMKEMAMELDLRSQLETGIAIQDSAMAAQALSGIANVEGQSNYVKLHTILLQNFGKTPEQILSDPSSLAQIQLMQNDSTDRSAYVKANLLLKSIGLSDYQPYYLESSKNDSSLSRKGSKDLIALLSSSSLSSKPNPFKESTIIKATIAEKTQNAYVVITDMLGKELSRYPLQQGENEITFSATEINQQVLFCSLIIDGVKIKTNKMVLIK